MRSWTSLACGPPLLTEVNVHHAEVRISKNSRLAAPFHFLSDLCGGAVITLPPAVWWDLNPERLGGPLVKRLSSARVTILGSGPTSSFLLGTESTSPSDPSPLVHMRFLSISLCHSLSQINK